MDELTRGAELRLRQLGARARVAARTLTVRESTRSHVARLRARRARIELERDEVLRDLGRAVYAQDAAETESARARIVALDAVVATLEDQMSAALADADAQVEAMAFEVRPTVAVTHPAEPVQPDPVLNPPEPAQEPWPPPNEADPPEPAVIPEPSPQPPEEPYPPA